MNKVLRYLTVNVSIVKINIICNTGKSGSRDKFPVNFNIQHGGFFICYAIKRFTIYFDEFSACPSRHEKNRHLPGPH